MTTPAEAAGYKVGDKFRVLVPGFGWEIGQIIELEYDDGSPAPLFAGCGCTYKNGLDRKPGAYFSLSQVEKVVDNSETSDVESSHQVETDLTTTNKQEINKQEKQTMTELKLGDKVVIKKGITNFRYGRNSLMTLTTTMVLY